MLLFSPVSVAIVARDRGPRSTTWRSTTLRLCRRTARWLESSIAGFGVHMMNPRRRIVARAAAGAGRRDDRSGRRGGAIDSRSRRRQRERQRLAVAAGAQRLVGADGLREVIVTASLDTGPL